MLATDEKLFTTQEAADELGCRDWYLRRLFRRGLLPEPRRHAGARLLTQADVERARDVLARLDGTAPDTEGN